MGSDIGNGFAGTEWVKAYVQREIDRLINLLGEGLGTVHKRDRQAMLDHVANETGLVRNLIELERKKLEGKIESQAKLIKSLEARLARRKQDPESEASYRPSMRPARLM